MYRGSLERDPKNTNKLGLKALAQPLLVTALPTLGYAAYTRAPPPTVLATSLIGCALLHAYDRVWHPKGLHTDNMPTVKMNRRVF